MHRGAEAFKNIVIALLSCTLMVLMVLAVPGGEAAAKRAARSALGVFGLVPQDELTAASYGTAAQPILLSFRNEGGRSSVYGGELALKAAYETATPLFAEAFSTAEGGETVSDAALSEAMQKPSVYLAFDGLLPTEALSAWLGAEKTACTEAADGYLLSLSGSSVTLFVCGDRVTAYRTGIAGNTLRTAVDGIGYDGSAFACETESKLHPRTFLPGGRLALNGAQVSNPCTLSAAQEIAAALEFNPYGSGAYVDIGGSFVFSESGRTCTVTTDGTVRMTADVGQYDAFSAAADSAVSYIDAAQLALNAVCADRIGEARLSLRKFERTESGAVCTFGYHYQGVPVLPQTATAVFTGTQLTALTVPVCTFTDAQSETLPLPAAQAAVLVPDGDGMQLVYQTAADGSLTAEWSVKECRQES